MRFFVSTCSVSVFLFIVYNTDNKSRSLGLSSVLVVTGRLAAMASEEIEDIILIPDEYPTGHYVMVFDPLDGSSNIDYSVNIGTIFSIMRRKSPQGEPVTVKDCLQPGRDIVAAGYILYGPSTIMVYSAGNGVHVD